MGSFDRYWEGQRIYSSTLDNKIPSLYFASKTDLTKSFVFYLSFLLFFIIYKSVKYPQFCEYLQKKLHKPSQKNYKKIEKKVFFLNSDWRSTLQIGDAQSDQYQLLGVDLTVLGIDLVEEGDRGWLNGRLGVELKKFLFILVEN